MENSLVGKRIDCYQVVKELGRGGMGVVYLAEDTTLKQYFALKVLPAEQSKKKSFIERFYQEAQVMAALKHERIVRVICCKDFEGIYYLVMDYIVGPHGKVYNLEDYLQSQSKKLPAREVRRLILQVCEALYFAHTFKGEDSTGRKYEGVIHRDLKPANILLDQDLNVKVADFGLAKVLGEDFVRDQVSKSLAVAGTIVEDDPEHQEGTTRALLGTYDFMSPEQKEGREVDHRSDVYALGVMIYQMLIGHLPGAGAELPSKVNHSLPVYWDDIFRGCVKESPNGRFSSVKTIRRLVQKRAHRRMQIAVTAGVVTLGIIGGLFLWSPYCRESMLSGLKSIKSFVPGPNTLTTLPPDNGPGKTGDPRTEKPEVEDLEPVQGDTESQEQAGSVKKNMARSAFLEAKQRSMREVNPVLALEILEKYVSDHPDVTFTDEVESVLTESRSRMTTYYRDLCSSEELEKAAKDIIDSDFSPKEKAVCDLYKAGKENLVAGKYDEAVATFSSCQAKAESGIDKEHLGLLLAFAYEKSATTYQETGNWNEAYRVASEALEVFPESTRLRSVLKESERENILSVTRQRYEEALGACEAGSYEKAIIKFEEVIPQLNSYYTDLVNEKLKECHKALFDKYSLAARQYSNVKKWSESLEMIDKALIYKPGDTYLIRLKEEVLSFIVGEVLKAAAQKAEDEKYIEPTGRSALDLYKQALTLDPGNKKAKTGIKTIHGLCLEHGDAALAAGDRKKAEHFYLKCLEVVPGDKKAEEKLKEVRKLLASPAFTNPIVMLSIKTLVDDAEVTGLDICNFIAEKLTEQGVRVTRVAVPDGTISENLVDTARGVMCVSRGTAKFSLAEQGETYGIPFVRYSGSLSLSFTPAGEEHPFNINVDDAWGVGSNRDAAVGKLCNKLVEKMMAKLQEDKPSGESNLSRLKNMTKR